MKSVRGIGLSCLGLICLAVLGGAQAGAPDPAELQRIAEALVTQLDLAHQEAVFGMLAPHLGAAKLHAQRVINIVQGKNGPDYAPQGGDVGDGIGALTHAQRFRESIRAIPPLAQVFLLGIENVIFDISAKDVGAVEQVKRALRAPDLARARISLRAARALLYSARGSASDPVSEGGARAILARLKAGR